MIKSIVISHYNEDIEWISNIDKSIRIYLYTKGSQDLSFFNKIENIKIYNLQNVGKEQQTYFYHIVNNYNSLEDLMYFIQANPFEHCIDFLDKLNNNFIGPLSDFNLITSIYGQPDETKYKRHIDHKYGNALPSDIIGNIFIDPWNEDVSLYTINYIIDVIPELNIKKENWIYNANGLYSSTREKIQKIPKSVYDKCLSIFYDSNINMTEYAFERLQKFILLK